jgi:murein DD-endopeptidase MepM/ murein hydrolase activator NlpD
VLVVGARRHHSGGGRPDRPTRPNLIVAGLLLAIAVTWASPAASPVVHGSVANAPSPVPGARAIDPGAVAGGNRHDRLSSSIPGAASPAADSPVWLQLLAVETVIESVPPDTAAPLTAGSVQDRAGLAVALVAEEGIYKVAVRDPATANTLTNAAARTGDADAITAVSTDLAIVRTSMANAATADEARSMLARLDSLWSAQCAPLSFGRPLLTPMEGSISQPFGPTDLAFEPSRWVAGVLYPHYHTGLDITAPLGSPVHAAADGLVIVAGASTDAAGELVGYGQYVVIRHPDACTTLYGHLLDLTVHSGDKVIQGEIIGHEGSTGNSTGPHLHFEVRVDGEPVDPMPYLG